MPPQAILRRKCNERRDCLPVATVEMYKQRRTPWAPLGPGKRTAQYGRRIWNRDGTVSS